MAVQKNWPGIEIELYLVYYKKDNSDIKSIRISNDYIQKASDYWEDVHDYIDNVPIEQVKPGIHYGIPMHQWECKKAYCPYARAGECNSPFIDP